MSRTQSPVAEMRLAVQTSAKSRRRRSENTALRGSGRRLAGGAEIALAELVRVKADVDRRSALVARQSSTLLHRTELPAIERETRTPRATIAIAPQELARREDHAPELGVVEVQDLRPRPCARDEE